MDNFKVIIAGSRGFSNYKLLREQCNKYLREKRNTCNIIIVSGHAEVVFKCFGYLYINDNIYEKILE